MDGFPDDEVVGLRGIRRNNGPGQPEVPRVVDTTAETLGIQFERFLEGYEAGTAYAINVTDKMQLHRRSNAVGRPYIECCHNEQILHRTNTRALPI